MKNKNNKIEKILEETRFTELNLEEREKVWQGIVNSIDKEPIPSPFLWFLPVNNNKFMIPLMIGAMMFLGVGGTVVVADNSLPGDALYGINRATENVRIKVATGEKKGELRARFAEKRLAEVEALIAEARAEREASGSATTTTDTEADVKVGHGLETAVSYLNEVALKLEASENTVAQARVLAVIEKLEAKINEPDVRSQVRIDQSFKLKTENSNAKAEERSEARTDNRVEVREDGSRIRIIWRDKAQVNANAGAELRVENEDENEMENENNDSNGLDYLIPVRIQ